jgi:hypothetical protein
MFASELTLDQSTLRSSESQRPQRSSEVRPSPASMPGSPNDMQVLRPSRETIYDQLQKAAGQNLI